MNLYVNDINDLDALTARLSICVYLWSDIFLPFFKSVFLQFIR